MRAITKPSLPTRRWKQPFGFPIDILLAVSCRIRPSMSWTKRARINSMTRPPDVKEIEKNIETIRAEKEAAIKAQDYEKAVALRDSEKQTTDKLEQILNEWREKPEEREGGATREANN